MELLHTTKTDPESPAGPDREPCPITEPQIPTGIGVNTRFSVQGNFYQINIYPKSNDALSSLAAALDLVDPKLTSQTKQPDKPSES
jgi:hypothetical protein